MPYNSISAGRFSTNKNLYDEDGKALTDTAPRKEEKLYLVNGTPNYYFGMEVSAELCSAEEWTGHTKWKKRANGL